MADVRTFLSELPDPIQIQISTKALRTNLALFNNRSFPSGVRVSTGIPGLSFQQLLYSLKNKPYKIGMIGFIPPSLLQSQLSISHYDLRGNGKNYSMLFKVEPYQRQQTIYAPANFILDDLTNITISVIPAGTTTLQLFPYDPKLEKADFPDVGKTVAIAETNTVQTIQRRDVGKDVNSPSGSGQSTKTGKIPEYLKYRYAVGGILVLATIGLIAWLNKDLKE